jgi:hypothetical protein
MPSLLAVSHALLIAQQSHFTYEHNMIKIVLQSASVQDVFHKGT